MPILRAVSPTDGAGEELARGFLYTLAQRPPMTFRISKESCPSPTVKLAGRLEGDAVEVLVGACADVALDVTIDLSEVYYADEMGISALVALQARGAVLRGHRPYLALLLERKVPVRTTAQ